MKKTKSYLFSFGNSSVGPIGCCIRVRATGMGSSSSIIPADCCIRVRATGKREALKKIKEVFANQYLQDGECLPVIRPRDQNEDFEYANVYFNVDALTTKDIQEVDDNPS